MSKRFDSLDIYYKSIKTFAQISTVLYWFIFCCSLLLLFIKNSKYNDIITIIFIITVILLFISNILLKINLIPNVENKRRLHLLSNSLGIHLNNEKTVGYYNNNIEPSIYKLGVNIFENSLFAKKVCSKMLVIERIKIATCILIWLLMLLFRFDLSIIAIVAQTIFLGEVLYRWVYMEFLARENETIFNDMHNLFLCYTDDKREVFNARIIDNFVRYEAAKAYCGISQSSKIFFEINQQTTQEWEEIKKILKIEEI